jgi:hypothetical protein
MRHRLCLFALLSGVVAGATMLSGCATHADRLRDVRQQFCSGDLDAAAATIDRDIQRHRGEADVWKLERAMVDLAAGRPRQAEQTLREVRDRFDHFEQQSLGESALVMVTDDNRSAYAGEDYEKVLVRAMLALSNLMGDGGDATAYALQVTQKQNEIIEAGGVEGGENPKLAYKRLALGAYVHGILREETHTDYDDVERSMVKVVSWEPGFRPGHADLERARHGHHSAAGNGVLYVFTLVGRGPYKEETLEIPSTVALLVADRILSANGRHTLPPTIAPIRVPKVVLDSSPVRAVQVSIDGRPAGMTETITDVGQLAQQQYEAIYPEVIGRAVARRVVKKGIVYAGKEVVQVERNSLANFALDAAGVAWEATETADTRCWGLLPDRIQVARIELPAGMHQVGLQAAGAGGPLGTLRGAPVEIADGRNTYMLAWFPDNQLVGQILTSRQATGQARTEPRP